MTHLTHCLARYLARSNTLLPCRVFVLLCFALLSFGTAAQTAPRVTAADLDKAAYAFADRYTTQIVAATDAVLRDNPSPEQRRLAHQVKLVSVSGVYDIVTNAEPFAKLMDLLMVVTLQSYRWIDEDQAERHFGNRSAPLIQAKRMPFLITWQMESLMNELLVKPEFANSLKAADSLAKSADRTSLAVEKLPDQLAKEREALVATLEDRNGRLAGLMGEVRKTTTAADQLTARVHQVTASGERLTANLRDTASGVTETSRAVDQLLARHAGGPPNPNAKPFEIEPYVKASTELNQTVAGLNNLLGLTGALAEKRPWAAPAQEINAMLGSQIDYAFWRALMLICVFFALLFAYRWASLRWLKTA